MLTTGFKLWFGFFLGAVLAAVFAGYTSGATETGPLSLGWKGGVGNHVSYTILVTGAGVLALLGLELILDRLVPCGASWGLLAQDELQQAPPKMNPRRPKMHSRRPREIQNERRETPGGPK